MASTVWTPAASMELRPASDELNAFNAGDLPAFVPGVNLSRVDDDGSEQWRKLYEQATVSPVHES